MKLPKIFAAESNQMIFIVITMFLNFLGFSIIIPVLPFLLQRYLQDPKEIAVYFGLLMSIYALCQFLAAPGLGALSDRFGRRPILLISLFGSVVGYIFLGIGGALWVLFAGRIIDGLTGGNISTVFAYVADITEPKDRGKYYGLLGAAGGVGFMMGPAIGGLLGSINLVAPFFLAAIVTLLNMVWGYFVLPESLPKEHKVEQLDFKHLNPLRQFSHVLSIYALRWIFLVGFLFFLALNAMQGNASVFMKDVFHWNAAQVGMALFVVGVFDIVSQGFLVRKLLPKFGDTKVAIMGLILCIIGFSLASAMSIVMSPWIFYVAIIIYITGDGLFEPSISGLISSSVGPKMQGRVQGASQGMQSMARIIGPLFASWLYVYWRGLPYASDAAIMMVALILIFVAFSAINKHQQQVIVE